MTNQTTIEIQELANLLSLSGHPLTFGDDMEISGLGKGLLIKDTFAGYEARIEYVEDHYRVSDNFSNTTPYTWSRDGSIQIYKYADDENIYSYLLVV